MCEFLRLFVLCMYFVYVCVFCLRLYACVCFSDCVFSVCVCWMCVVLCLCVSLVFGFVSFLGVRTF